MKKAEVHHGTINMKVIVYNSKNMATWFNTSNNCYILRASAYKYGPSNGTSRKIDFAHFWPIDWP